MHGMSNKKNTLSFIVHNRCRYFASSLLYGGRHI